MTVAILVVLLWCGVAVLLGLALGIVLRAVSRDDTPAEGLHDDALTREKAHAGSGTGDEPAVEPPSGAEGRTALRKRERGRTLGKG